MSEKKSIEWFDFRLPVYAKGDDLRYFLEVFDKEPKSASFLRLASQYENAAKLCKRVASVLNESKNPIDVIADEHVIELGGMPEDLGGLLADEVVTKIEFSDLDDNESDGLLDFSDEVLEDDDGLDGIY